LYGDDGDDDDNEEEEEGNASTKSAGAVANKGSRKSEIKVSN
jgi:hypothetical protein